MSGTDWRARVDAEVWGTPSTPMPTVSAELAREIAERLDAAEAEIARLRAENAMVRRERDEWRDEWNKLNSDLEGQEARDAEVGRLLRETGCHTVFEESPAGLWVARAGWHHSEWRTGYGDDLAAALRALRAEIEEGR